MVSLNHFPLQFIKKIVVFLGVNHLPQALIYHSDYAEGRQYFNSYHPNKTLYDIGALFTLSSQSLLQNFSSCSHSLNAKRSCCLLLPQNK